MHILENIKTKETLLELEYSIMFPVEEIPTFTRILLQFISYTPRLNLVPKMKAIGDTGDKVLVRIYLIVEELTILKLTLSHDAVYEKVIQ
jgi:hypothetical protein